MIDDPSSNGSRSHWDCKRPPPPPPPPPQPEEFNPAYTQPPWNEPDIPDGGAVVYLSKVDNSGELFHPGTMSLRRKDGVVDNSDGKPYYYEEAWHKDSAGVDPGYRPMLLESSDLDGGNRWFEFATQIVDGYEVWYNTSLNTHAHRSKEWHRYEPTTQFFHDTLQNLPTYGYTNGTRLTAQLTPNHYIDVAFKYVRRNTSAVDRVGEKLTCNFPGNGVPAVGTSKAFSTDDFKLDLGVSRFIGGVPVQMNLFALKSSAPSSSIQVIRAASAGGSSWQIAFMMTDPSTGDQYVANQAAGNLTEQWGYLTDFVDRDNSWEQLYYVPIATDHVIRPDPPEHDSGSRATSPCYNNAFRFFDGKVSFDYSKQTKNGKSVVTIVNGYTLRSLRDQTWTNFSVDQSMYMPAADSDSTENRLRIYLAKGTPGVDRKISNALTSDWDKDAPQPRLCDQSGEFKRAACDCKNQGGKECFMIADDVSYVVLIWNVHGVDVGVAVHRPKNGEFTAQLHLENAHELHWANIQFHTWIEEHQSKTINLGDEQSYQMAYTFGSLDELAANGFGIKN